MMTDDELLALAKIGVGIAANEVPELIERHRAEVERLTRERNEARVDQAIANNLARAGLQKREAAEAALSAAQERVRALEELVREVAHEDGPREAVSEHNAFPFFSKLNRRLCELRDKARAVLAPPASKT